MSSEDNKKVDEIQSESNGKSNNFIGSLDLDEIDSPLKEVEQCLNRLESINLNEKSIDLELKLKVCYVSLLIIFLKSN